MTGQAFAPRFSAPLGLVCGLCIGGLVTFLTLATGPASDGRLRLPDAVLLVYNRTSAQRSHTAAAAGAEEPAAEAANRGGAGGFSAAVQPSNAKPEPPKTCRSRAFLGRPKSHCSCTWQEEYATLHRRVEARELPPRYAAVYCTTGLADCIKGAISIFYYALLTGRAFKLHLQPKYAGEIKYEWAFDAPNINWTFPWNSTQAQSGTLPNLNSSFLGTAWPKPGDPLRDMWAKRDLNLHTPSAELVYFAYCTPAAHLAIADNPHHKSQLRDMGIYPHNMFSCAMDFLFEPNAALLERFKPEMEALSDTNALKIGIQIRHGDYFTEDVQGFENHRVTVRGYRHMFRCVEDINRTQNLDGRRLIIYLITDSMNLRKDAVEQYGNATLLTALTGIELAHVAINEIGSEEVRRNAVVSAAGEMWLFGFVDFHVITMHSGFGQVGALWGHTFQSRYTLIANVKRGEPRPLKRACGIHDYDRDDIWLGT